MRPSLWKCLDRVLSFKILLADIPGKANSVNDFLSRMQTDPNLQLQIKVADHTPIREIEMKKEAEAPNVSSSNNIQIGPFFEKLQLAVDEHFIAQLKAHGLYDQFLAKQPSDDSDIQIKSYCYLSSIQQLVLIGSTIFRLF